MVLNAIQFLEEFGYKIRNINIENHSKSFLFQSVGIVIQRKKGKIIKTILFKTISNKHLTQ